MFSGLKLLGANLETEVEKFIGKQVVTAFESLYGVMADPLLTGWVGLVGKRVGDCSKRKDVNYEFRILNSDLVNAFAAPGGFIFVTKGLLEFVESDDELACILGHEVGHVEEKHAFKELKHQGIIWLFLNSLKNEKYADFVQLAQILNYFLALKYSRDCEFRADRMSVRLAHEAGFDPAEILRFLKRIQDFEKKPSELQVYFSTHPPTIHRIDRIKQEPLLKPDNLEAIVQIAQNYHRRHLYNQAIEKFRQVLDIAPNNIRARLSLAEALVGVGKVEEARREYQHILAIEPDNAIACEGIERLGKVSEIEELKESGKLRELEEIEELTRCIEKLEISKEDLGAKVSELTQGINQIYRTYRSNMMLQDLLISRVQATNIKSLYIFYKMYDLMEKMGNGLASLRRVSQESLGVIEQLVELNRELQLTIGKASKGCFLGELKELTKLVVVESQVGASELGRGLELTLRALEGLEETNRSVGLMLAQLDYPFQSSYISITRLELLESAVLGLERAINSTLRHIDSANYLLDCAKVRYLKFHVDLKCLNLPVRFFATILSEQMGLAKDLVEELHQAGYSCGDICIILFLSKEVNQSVDEILRLNEEGKFWIDAIKQAKLPIGSISVLLKITNKQIERAMG